MSKPSRKHQKVTRSSFVDLRRTDSKSTIEDVAKFIDAQTCVITNSPSKLLEKLKKCFPQLTWKGPDLRRFMILLRHRPIVYRNGSVPVPLRKKFNHSLALWWLREPVLPITGLANIVTIFFLCWRHKLTKLTKPLPFEVEMPLDWLIEVLRNWAVQVSLPPCFNVRNLIQDLVLWTSSSVMVNLVCLDLPNADPAMFLKAT